MSAFDAVHTTAGNLLLAFYVRSQMVEGSQTSVFAGERFVALCEAGVRAGLAQSIDELELLVSDVVDQVPPPAPADRSGAWIWMMQARWILARRLRDRQIGLAAA